MARISIDLLDGKTPVNFSLGGDDLTRFTEFMGKYAKLQRAVNEAHSRLDNTVAAGQIPMPDSLRVQALSQITESLRDELAPLVDE